MGKVGEAGPMRVVVWGRLKYHQAMAEMRRSSGDPEGIGIGGGK